MNHFTKFLDKVTQEDAYFLKKAFESYGDSWKKRGGVGAFMMLARKWDRLEHSLEKKNQYDIFEAIEKDRRPEGIIDDIRDLRRYLVLVETEMLTRGQLPMSVREDRFEAATKEDLTGQDHPFGHTPEDDS
tara:strand:+ start:15874 stop:16266 length:393 start_codon:yes stop_codon:yes gene_type:complete